MKKNTPQIEAVESRNPVNYLEIRVKSTPKPRYASSRLIVYGKGLSEASLLEMIRQKLGKIMLNGKSSQGLRSPTPRDPGARPR